MAVGEHLLVDVPEGLEALARREHDALRAARVLPHKPGARAGTDFSQDVGDEEATVRLYSLGKQASAIEACARRWGGHRPTAARPSRSAVSSRARTL